MPNNQDNDVPKYDPDKIFTNPNEAYNNWLLKRKDINEYKRRKWLGGARKRAKAMNTIKRKETDGNDTNQTKENQSEA